MPVEPNPDRGSTDVGATLDLLFRRRSAQLTATLARILGLDQLDLVEDVVQDAFIQALRRWPSSGVPDKPGAWVLRVAKNGAIDALRRQGRWREKQAELERSILPESAGEVGGRAFFSTEIEDDELRMIFAMCHPALARDAQVALTLKSVGGFGVGEIARAFLTSKTTIAQRLVRAKRSLREKQVVLRMPDASTLPEHMTAVLEVLYLMFNEGHSAATHDELVRSDLCGEAIRLAELLAAHPTVGEPRVEALAALFLFQAARIPARTVDGELVPLERQDRDLWDRRMMRRALAYQRRSARGTSVTAYHLQAEIAGCHTLAKSFEQTDWKRILSCYDALLAIDPSPVVALNRTVAVAEVEGPAAGLEALQSLKQESSLDTYYHLFAIEAELLGRVGQPREAYQAASVALSLVESPPVRHYLERRARHHLESCT